MPDCELLQRYAATNSEDAFAELVRRHVNLIYSAALRQVNGDTHLARDVAQTVFIQLARNARSLASHRTLIGWLYTSTHFAAAKIVRGEHRRRDREEKFMREFLHETAPEADWQKIRPTLDAAMHELKEADREAILLRYFENRQFAEVGAMLGLTENAARMRVDRALEKLHSHLTKHGITTAATLASAITANAVQIASPGLAAMLTAASITAAGTGTSTLLKIMSLTKLKIAAGAIVAAGAATALVIQYQTQTTLAAENQSLRQQISQLQADNESLSNAAPTTANSVPLPDDQSKELLRLRAEVSALRGKVSDLGKLRKENQRLQAAQLDPNVLRQAVIEAEKQEHETIIHKMSDGKKGMLGFLMFADDNQKQFPSNFQQLSPYLADGLEQIESNFDIVYQGSMSSITNASTAIVLKEKQPWQALNGKWIKTYAFADGHTEAHSEEDNNFDEFETQHTLPPPQNQ